MDVDVALSCIAIAILIVLSAFFSATETAYSSLNRIRIKNYANNGNKKAQAVQKTIENYDSFISTILIGNNIVNLAAAALSANLFAKLITGNAGLAGTLSTVVMTVLVLLFGEVTPKTFAKNYPEKFAMFVSPIVKFCYIILYPLNWLIGLWQKLFNKLLKPKADEAITDDELITIVEEAETEGGLDEYEGELIRSAIEFDDLTVIDVLTPRVDVEAVTVEATMEEVLKQFRETGYSRLPVYKETIDTVLGVINEKDFYKLYLDGKKKWNEIIAKVVVTTPRMKISTLMRQLQKAKSHLAVVVDEFGGTMGIVTLEDIVEELVGEIWDEHDDVVESFQKLSDTVYRVAGDVALDDFFEYFDVNKSNEEFEPVQLSGFIVLEIGKAPVVGDTLEFENLKITVTKADFYRIVEVEVVVMPPNSDNETDGEKD